MIGLPYGEKKLWQYVKPFSSDTGTSGTHGLTDGQTDAWTDRQTGRTTRVHGLPEDETAQSYVC